MKSLALTALVAAVLGAVIGRWTAPASQAQAPASRSDDRGADPERGLEPRPRREGTGAAASAAGAAGAPGLAATEASQAGAPSPASATVPRTLAECTTGLQQLTAEREERERHRRATDGEPIAPRPDAAPRFQEKPLLATFQNAFRATGISGRVDTVDCTEYPCIVYGRVNGDEELVAKLEDSKPFSAYDEDIGVMLTWSSGDHARGHSPKQTGDRAKPSEISLFAFAFYTDADRAKHGDTIDRRIRARTADLWNALSHDDP